MQLLKEKTMEIKTVKVGWLETNCYIIKSGNECLIIDPGGEPDKIIKEINNLKPIGIIITHYHFDHVGALEDIKNKYNIPVYDINNLEEKEYKIGNFDFEVIYTKGHHNTCITIYFKNEQKMFVGDFIFKDGIGRTDLEDADADEMIKSLNKIKQYPDDIMIYPGHGDITRLGDEKLFI